MKRVLIVDDSSYVRRKLRETLTENGFEVVGEAENGEKAIDLGLELQPDLITLDNILPDMLGPDVLRIYKQNNLAAKVIMISAVGQQSAVEEGLSIGAVDYIIKPFDEQELIKLMNKAIENP